MARKKKKKKPSSLRYWLVGFVAVVSVVLVFRRYIFDNQYPASALQYEVFGVDVSRHSGEIDWSKLKSQNVRFAYIKATEGEDYIDPLFAVNSASARKEKILFGAYHFFRFNKNGKKQAEHFLNYCQSFKGQLIPAVDVETHGNGLCTKSDEEVISELKMLIQAIEGQIGLKPVIYTNTEAYNRFIKNQFSGYPLWFCDLSNEPTVTTSQWDIWQFTHRGKMDGAPYRIDFNVYRNSYSDLVKRLVVK